MNKTKDFLFKTLLASSLIGIPATLSASLMANFIEQVTVTLISTLIIIYAVYRFPPWKLGSVSILKMIITSFSLSYFLVWLNHSIHVPFLYHIIYSYLSGEPIAFLILIGSILIVEGVSKWVKKKN